MPPRNSDKNWDSVRDSLLESQHRDLRPASLCAAYPLIRSANQFLAQGYPLQVCLDQRSMFVVLIEPIFDDGFDAWKVQL